MTSEFILTFVALVFVTGVGAYLWRRPAIIGDNYQSQINALRADLKATREELQIERRSGMANRETLETMLRRNYQLYNELQRQNDINSWLRQQLRDRHIELPPLPPELRESRLEAVGVAIHIDQSGVSINDNATLNTRDIVGGDVAKHDDLNAGGDVTKK